MSESSATEIEAEIHDQIAEMRGTWEKNTKTVGNLFKAVVILITGAFALGTWATTLEWRQRTAEGIAIKVESLERWKERSEAIKVPETIGDISKSLTEQDKRLQRVEDKVGDINETLDRIESSLIRQHQAASNPGGKP